MNTDELISIPDAAALKGISRAAIYNAIADGRLPAVEALGIRVLRRADLESFQPRAYRDRAGSKGRGGRPCKQVVG